MKYLGLIIFLSLVITGITMQFLPQSLLIDLMVYIVVALILSLLLVIINPKVRAQLLQHK